MSEQKTETYDCLNPILHNGKRYTDTIELTAEEAAPLVAARAVSKRGAKAVDQDPLQAMKVDELKAKAAELGVENAEQLKKGELIDAIKAAEASAG